MPHTTIMKYHDTFVSVVGFMLSSKRITTARAIILIINSETDRFLFALFVIASLFWRVWCKYFKSLIQNYILAIKYFGWKEAVYGGAIGDWKLVS